MSLAGPAAAEQTTDFRFTVSRGDHPIGTQEIKINRGSVAARITVSTHMKVKVALITPYHFDQTSSKNWSSGQLISLTSTTDDNGAVRRLALLRQGGVLSGDCEGKRLSVAGMDTPASLWNASMLRSGSLFSNIDGHVMKVKVRDLGASTLSVRGAATAVSHYELSGGLSKELWFTEDGLLARLRLPGPDGSAVTFVRD
jgi:WD40 repeat protein